MSRKKKASPMWTEVNEPIRLKVGDIILWPKEVGPVKHLHGSVSTMRKLGFSVGRCRQTSYKQLRSLQTKSDRNRLFMVVKVHTNLHATRQMELVGITNENPIVSCVNTREIPLGCSLKTPDEAMISFIRGSYIMDNGTDIIRDNKFLGADDDHLGSAEEDICLQGLMEMRNRKFPHVKGVGKYIEGTLYRKEFHDSLYDPGQLVDVITDSFATFESDKRESETCITFNAKVLQNAHRYGMKVYRPSPKMYKELIAAMTAFSLGLITKRNRQYLEFTETFIEIINNFRKRLVRYTSKACGLTKRNFAVAAPTLKMLSEITGEFPDCTP